MLYDKIPKELKMIPRWVCVWNNSKNPMQASVRKGASSTNPATWSSFDDAVFAVDNKIYDNIGFVFNGDGYVGIDIDAGFDDDGFLSELSIDIMGACGSYTEKSRSGRGVHIILKGKLPFSGKNNKQNVEIYEKGRYFIMTGKKLVYPTIIENQNAIDYVVDKYFADYVKESNNNKSSRIYTPQYKEYTGGKLSLTPTYPKIPRGCRNISLTSLAGQLHVQGYAPKEIYTELLKCNSQACDPPLSAREVESIVNSVTRYRR